MDLLPKIVKILSEDSLLIENRFEFVHSLGISETKVASLMALFAMGQCQPYHLIHAILSEWIVTGEDSATVKELRKILQGIKNFNHCSDKLRELEEIFPGPIQIPGVRTSLENDAFGMPQSTTNPATNEPTSIAFGVKDVVMNFMGRDEELKRLNEYFHSRNCHSALLSGLGGIGKTELAKQFTLDISDPSGSIKIVKSWLAGESPQTLLNSTTQFCHHLRLSATDSDGQPLGIQEMLKNILTRLKSTAELSRWLVIIDNVDEIHQEFQTALKTLFDFGSFVFLIVTSRRRDISAGELLEVTEFKIHDSIKFIKNSLPIEDSSETALVELCSQLGNFPLALSQAIGYIKQQQRQSLTGMGVQNYLNELAKNESLGLDKDMEFAEYPKAALKVWHLTLDKIEGDHGTEGRMALNLLDVMAFIIPDNIQISCLHKLFKRFYACEDIELEKFHSSLKILIQYSLISSYNSLISIHRLVQLALRQRISSKSSQNPPRSDAEILKLFWTSFDRKEWKQNDMPNILNIWKHSCNQPDLHEQIAIESYFLSEQLYDLGMVNESYDFATECSKFLLELFGPENKGYFLMEQRLAVAMRGKGIYKSSLEKLTSVYGKLKELCGEDDKQTLRTGHLIASVLFDLKRYKESLEWDQKVLQSKIIIYGEKSKSTMQTKHNLASTLQDSGKREEALKMYNEILEWQEVHLGKYHSSTLTTRHNIGICSYHAGKYAEARDIFQNVLPFREIHLGIEHPHTLNTKSWLADTLRAMGEIDDALKITEEVAIAREKILGPDHPDTVYARNKATLLKNHPWVARAVNKCNIS